MREVEVAVREACGYPASELGVPLMRKAFHPETGPLSEPGQEAGERQAHSDLFAGAIGSYTRIRTVTAECYSGQRRRSK